MLDIVDLISVGFLRSSGRVSVFPSDKTRGGPEIGGWPVHLRRTRSHVLAWHGVDRTESSFRWSIQRHTCRKRSRAPSVSLREPPRIKSGAGSSPR